MDLHTKEILSYNIGYTPNVRLVTDMLDQDLKHQSLEDLTIHSDQGFHYQNRAYISRLKDHGITQSMSRKGNCLDNAVIENFFGILKSEMYYTERFKTPSQFIRSLKAYIKYYNEERISCKLKGMTPAQYHHHSLSVI
jgi:transposase InsO family protein